MHKIAKEYLHLLKTKTGLEKSIKKKEVELAKECRAIISYNKNCEYTKSRMALFAEIILEQINGR